MNTDGGWVLPLVIEPEDGICFQIVVPNDVFHLAAFKGAIWELTRWYNWARDPDHLAIQVADVWKGIYEAVHSGDNCEMGTFDIRQKPDAPCIIQKLPYGDTWVDSVNIQLCPPQVRVNNGVVQWFNPDTGLWENVEAGDERSNGTAPVPWPSPPVGETGNCLAAENIAAYYQSVLTSIRADVVLGKSVTIIAAGVTSVLSLFIPPMLFGTIALSLSAAALTLGEVGLGIMLQEEHIDNFKCVVYCHAETDGSITTSAFDAIRTGMGEWASGLELSIIQYYLDSLGSVGLQRQGAALGITTGHCDDCDCTITWCLDLDLTTSNYSMINPPYIVHPAGLWVSGSGWTSTDEIYQSSSDIVRWVQRRYDLGATYTITSVTLTYDYVRGANTTDGNQEASIGYDGYTSVELPGTGNGNDKTLTRTHDAAVQYIDWAVTPDYSHGATLTGTGNGTHLHIEGTGDMPLGAVLC